MSRFQLKLPLLYRAMPHFHAQQASRSGMRNSPLAILTLTLAAAACSTAPGQSTRSTTQGTDAPPKIAIMGESPPAMAFLSSPDPVARSGSSARSNASMIRDFIDLTFELESGRPLPVFSRFETPITIAMTGAVPASAAPELAALLARLRDEARIDIRAAAASDAPNITVHFAPRAQLRRLAPSAACFVVPNAATLAEFIALRGTAAVDWGRVVQRQKAGIFVPAEASPQEVRDCLHEEVAQAIGPLNDLYRLSVSTFNDDNFHSVLTRFDMLILRAYYAPELRSGLTREEVARRLPALLARINPETGEEGNASTSATTRVWKAAIETALGAGGATAEARKAAADRALRIAKAQGWADNRLAFSHFAMARLYTHSDRARATEHFLRAAQIYRSLPGTAVHIAHIDMQLAAMALAAALPNEALTYTDRAIPAIKAAQNPALLATTLLIKAEALDQLGRGDEAQALRMDSLQWASYGFGSDAQVLARQREIAVLGAQGSRG